MLKEASDAEIEGLLFIYLFIFNVSFYISFIILQRWAFMGANFNCNTTSETNILNILDVVKTPSHNSHVFVIDNVLC